MAANRSTDSSVSLLVVSAMILRSGTPSSQEEIAAHGTLAGLWIILRTGTATQGNQQRGQSTLVKIERMLQPRIQHRRRTSVVFRRPENGDGIGLPSLVVKRFPWIWINNHQNQAKQTSNAMATMPPECVACWRALRVSSSPCLPSQFSALYMASLKTALRATGPFLAARGRSRVSELHPHARICTGSGSGGQVDDRRRKASPVGPPSTINGRRSPS